MPFSTRFGHSYILLFWVVVMGVVWVAFAQDAGLPRGDVYVFF